jgi:hypothetical protein
MKIRWKWYLEVDWIKLAKGTVRIECTMTTVTCQEFLTTDGTACFKLRPLCLRVWVGWAQEKLWRRFVTAEGTQRQNVAWTANYEFQKLSRNLTTKEKDTRNRKSDAQDRIRDTRPPEWKSRNSVRSQLLLCSGYTVVLEHMVTQNEVWSVTTRPAWNSGCTTHRASPYWQRSIALKQHR